MMRRSMFFLAVVVLVAFGLPASEISAGMETITIDAGVTLRSLSGSPVGVNTNYLMDDDHNRPGVARSTAAALGSMGMRFLRYPGGDKSDNYLWSVSPFDSSRPTLARIGPNEWPSGDRNLVEADNQTFKIDPLDFDEFMAMAQSVGAEPILVMNFDSAFKAAEPGGSVPTLAQLQETAVGWVRYCKAKGYSCKYWSIGNESQNGSHNGKPTQAQYIAGFKSFASAMKAADPSILIGANGHQSAWWQAVIEQAGDSIDWLDVHTYPAYGWSSYTDYRNYSGAITYEVDRAAAALASYGTAAQKSRIFLGVTEYGALNWSGWGHANDLGHALMAAELTGAMLQKPNIRFMTLWNTRWVDQKQPLTDALRPDNSITPAGDAIALWSGVLGDRVVKSSSSSKVRATASRKGGELVIVLINKDTASHSIAVALRGWSPSSSNVARSVYGGGLPSDTGPVWRSLSPATVASGKIVLTVEKNSITVLRVAGR